MLVFYRHGLPELCSHYQMTKKKKKIKMCLEQAGWNTIGSEKELINPNRHTLVSIVLFPCIKVSSLLIMEKFINLNARQHLTVRESSSMSSKTSWTWEQGLEITHLASSEVPHGGSWSLSAKLLLALPACTVFPSYHTILYSEKN